MSTVLPVRTACDRDPVPSDAERAALAFARYDRWLRTEALPLWSTTGLGPQGGAFEQLTLDGRPDSIGYSRLRVQARQLYVFSHAHLAGEPGMLEPARKVFDFLVTHGRSPEGGWVLRLGEEGGVVDGTRDLYCQAFVILGLAWWYRASGDPRGLALARETLDVIETRFARGDALGWISRLPDHGEGQQNPHMHLFEALLALQAVAPDARTEDWLRRIRALFDARLFDPRTGMLGEFFDRDWRLVEGARGRLVEPGHHYEWVWLLHQGERAGIGAAQPAAGQLFDVAERMGLTPRGLIRDVITRDGEAIAPDHRCWPQTERIKAILALGEASGRTDMAALADAMETLWAHYLAPGPSGAWIDRVQSDGTPCAADIPASTLYHLFVLHAELVRLAPTLFAPGPASAAS